MAELPGGFADALVDLKALETDSQFGIEVVRIRSPKKEGEPLLVDVSVDCRSFQQAGKGLKLRSRERFWLYFEPGFPLNPPSVFAPDKRFAFSDHVYWMDELGVYLCLYYSIDQQWQPAHGVTGFVYKFMQWLEDAAAGTLDRPAQPLHPPQVRGHRAKEFFVARANCPRFEGAWLGYAVLAPKPGRRFDLVDWTKDFTKHKHNTLAPAILIDRPFVSEFPKYVSSLLIFLEYLGVDKEILAGRLLVHARHTTGRPPMYLVFGVAMRGTVGERAEQHLVVWRIDDRGANDLRNLVKRRKRYSEKGVEAVFAKGAKLIEQWKESEGRLTYCAVYEDRPNIVERRDGESGVAWFRGKTVTLWGVGALGSPIAEHLVRTGVAELRIVDSGRVTPGLLVRQNYGDADIGKRKVAALKDRLLTISPNLSVVAVPRHIGSEGEWLAETLVDAEFLIDATASQRVALVIDRLLRDKGPRPFPIVTVANDARAQAGLVTVTPSGGELGPTDLLHRAFLRLCDLDATEWLDAFWPVSNESNWFEPEPGCSAPTFRGSNAEAGALAGGMLARIGAEIMRSPTSLVLCGQTMAIKDPQGQCLEFAAGEHRQCRETNYEVRFFAEASADMKDIIDREQQGEMEPMETGGVLFGYRDDYLRVMWVVAAAPPPADSVRARHEFVCGVEGVAEATAEWQQRSSGLVGFLGTWHSHPVSAAEPSVVDLDAMAELLRQSGSPRHRLLLIIVGYSASCPSVGSYVFGGQSGEPAQPNEDVLEEEERQ